MNNSDTGSRMLRGALILTAAAVLSKLIGTLQKIPLQNIGGDGVFGIYNTVYPFYTLLITAAVVGLPAAISKFVAEAEVAGDRRQGEEVLRLSTLMLAGIGFITGLFMYFGAPWIAGWIDNSHVIPSIRSASFAFLVVPVMTGLRGYFQGLQNMLPTAVSQVAEQSVRVATMMVLLFLLLGQDASFDQISAGAVFGSAAGGAAGLLIMLLYWHRQRRMNRLLQTSAGTARAEAAAAGSMPAVRNRWQLSRQLLRYGIPVCLSTLSVPLMSLADTFTVPRLLKHDGFSEAGAMVQFGIYNRGIPLVQLVTMIATSLSVLFIPAMAEARMKGGDEWVRRQASASLRWFWLIGLAAAAGLAVLAQPVNIALYQDDLGSGVMQWIAVTAVGGTISIITAALLQGLGSVRAPALFMLAATAAKVLLNVLLVPRLGITGAAVSGAAAYLLSALLNAALLARLVRLRLAWRAAVLKPALLIAAMSAAAAAVSHGTGMLLGAAGLAAGSRTAALAQSLLGAAAGSGVVLFGAVLLRLLTADELAALPKLGVPLAQLLRRLRVLR
ncbi:polysaccharide biosynthesis protein [Paenibacillus sp. JX-17]|uniref:Polysaccharide biosynthesis protein n=1 Tax=Paenibacillus lacisoli TaxID=3064525 RepID=A0ABT9CKY1_9BACL|nr:polysaccharide biosynthesis protein [Paenibacillus sp. JX-17]MDO7908577.1 polysaccharide biosynthesis protein [Paenibacillus sp. JX-17]